LCHQCRLETLGAAAAVLMMMMVMADNRLLMTTATTATPTTTTTTQQQQQPGETYIMPDDSCQLIVNVEGTKTAFEVVVEKSCRKSL